MKLVKPDDVVLHLVDNESIQGLSIVEGPVDTNFTCLPGTEWDKWNRQKAWVLREVEEL